MGDTAGFGACGAGVSIKLLLAWVDPTEVVHPQCSALLSLDDGGQGKSSTKFSNGLKVLGPKIAQVTYVLDQLVENVHCCCVLGNLLVVGLRLQSTYLSLLVVDATLLFLQ